MGREREKKIEEREEEDCTVEETGRKEQPRREREEEREVEIYI